MPELMDRLLLMLDARSILSLAEVQPLAVQILRGGSQPWRKLIKEAVDNPIFKRQTLVQKIATTVLAKMKNRQSLMLELLDLICAKYDAEELRKAKEGWVSRQESGPPTYVQVSCPLHGSHAVSGYGFILLEECEDTLGSAVQKVVSVFEGDFEWEKMSDFEVFSVSKRLMRQPDLLESMQFSKISLRNKDLLDHWAHLLGNCTCSEVRGLREVGVYVDIDTEDWRYFAKALRWHKHGEPYKLQFRSFDDLMIQARSEDLKIIWEGMLEGSSFFVNSKVGPMKEFFKGSENAENERTWAELLQFLKKHGGEEKPQARNS